MSGGPPLSIKLSNLCLLFPLWKLRSFQGFFYSQIFAEFFSTCTKDFSWKKNGPNSPNFEEKYIQIARFFTISFRSSQERRRIRYIVSTFIYLVCSQIWLNYFLDDHHYKFDYITKSLKRNPGGPFISSELKKRSSLESSSKIMRETKVQIWHIDGTIVVDEQTFLAFDDNRRCQAPDAINFENS